MLKSFKNILNYLNKCLCLSLNILNFEFNFNDNLDTMSNKDFKSTNLKFFERVSIVRIHIWTSQYEKFNFQNFYIFA